MGNRLTKIYTKTGDQGTTGLGDGSRVDKSSLRVESMGDVDELNSLLGLLLTEDIGEDIIQPLIGIQHVFIQCWRRIIHSGGKHDFSRVC